MAHRYKLDFDGQSVLQADYNNLAIESSTGEDHVYAELFRLLPDNAGTIARGVIPYDLAPLIVPNGATGSILVNPFRVVIGTRTLEATDAVANYQDVRSSLSIADGAVLRQIFVAIATNASGNPRWDALYAAVTIDATSTPTTRKVKNPGTGVVTDEAVSVYTRTSVGLNLVTGTPGASPAFPAIPADGGGIYYVLLGYIRVPNGFVAGVTTVLDKNVNYSTPGLGISSATGVSTLRPANQSSINGGVAISSAGTSTRNGVLKWTGTTVTRPAAYMPATMCGSDSLMIAIDLGNAASANWTHVTGDIIDNSRDWRGRIFKWTVWGCQGGTSKPYPWKAVDGDFTLPSSVGFSTPGVGANSTFAIGAGQSFVADVGLLRQIAQLDTGNLPCQVAATSVRLYVDATTGAMMIDIAGVPLMYYFIWLDASAPYANY